MSNRNPDKNPLHGTGHIPAEVLARARKFDKDMPAPTWYAGRVEGESEWQRSGPHADDVATPPTARLSDETLGAIAHENRPPHPLRLGVRNGATWLQHVVVMLVQLLVAFVRRLGSGRTERRPV